ncbi:MAG: YigZ family protein [Clostridia bacterium]|nr:YigZ family protein [Clostridia bacterium]
MQTTYKTIRTRADESFEEKKSIFIGHAAPVSTEADALSFLNEIRSAYPDATHNVYAYVLRENGTTRYSDDREPQGTAGMPVLDVLRKAEITDTIVVVTRYFGGTLLGTGGLVRAYTQAAKLAVEAGCVVTRAKLSMLALVCTYADYQKISPVLGTEGIRVDSTDFGADVIVRVAMLTEEKDPFCHRVTEISGGRAIFLDEGERFDYL